MSQLASTDTATTTATTASEVFRLSMACIDADALNEIASECSDMGSEPVQWPTDTITVCIQKTSLILTDRYDRRILEMGHEVTGFYTACAYMRLLRNLWVLDEHAGRAAGSTSVVVEFVDERTREPRIYYAQFAIRGGGGADEPKRA